MPRLVGMFASIRKTRKESAITKTKEKVEVLLVDGRRVQQAGAAAADAPESGAEASAGRGRGKKASGEKQAAAEEVASPATEAGKVSLRKSPKAGWATVSVPSVAVRDALLREHAEVLVQGGVAVKLQPQVDPKTTEPVPTQIFASWGRKAEEKAPLAEAVLLRCFEALVERAEIAFQRSAPAQAAGEHVRVRKAAAGGCAVVTLHGARSRDLVLALGPSAVVTPPGVTVKLQPQRDPKTKEEVPTDIFVAWGRKVEEATPVPEEALVSCFEALLKSVAAPAAAPQADSPAESV